VDVNVKTDSWNNGWSNGWTPLLFAAESGNLELAKLLVERGADVNAKSDDGLTVLSYAYNSNNKELVKFLKEHGAKKSKR
jgi:ankyrin repeat protein